MSDTEDTDDMSPKRKWIVESGEKWIVEACELRAMTPSDVAALKAYLSRRDRLEKKEVAP